MPPWNSAKAKVQLRLSVQRLRTLQQKKEAQAKASRRDIATLLEKGKIETAKVKVETIINEDIHVELLELLELYCELLLARFGLLEQNSREPDPGISEGLCSIIYAAPRTELKELHILRDILMHKYGREFSVAVMDNRDGCVSERVSRKISVATPSPELVDAYLAEIAKAYGVPWSPPSKNRIDHDVLDGGVKEVLVTPTGLSGSASDSTTTIEHSEPITTTSHKSTDDNESTAPGTTQDEAVSPKSEDSFDLLSKRFAALKKR